MKTTHRGMTTEVNALDLFLQDFVGANRIMGQHYSWDALVSRRYMEDGRCRIFRFQSGGRDYLARAQQVLLPDADWLRIHIKRPEIPTLPAEEFRFDCLRMMSQTTHYQMDVQRDGTDGSVIVRLATRNRGLMNIVFVIQKGDDSDNPFLLV